MFHEPQRPTPRSDHLAFRVTRAEREFVQAAATNAGISVGQLIRRAVARETERDEEPVSAEPP
jgi:predicted HicB family RNase H-like nuclease